MPSTTISNESTIQHDVLDYLNRFPGWFIWRQGGHAVYDPIRRVFRKPGKFEMKGRSDLVGTYKGKIICLEIKTPEGRISPDQAVFLKKIKDLGGYAWILRSLTEAVELRKAVENGLV